MNEEYALMCERSFYRGAIAKHPLIWIAPDNVPHVEFEKFGFDDIQIRALDLGAVELSWDDGKSQHYCSIPSLIKIFEILRDAGPKLTLLQLMEIAFYCGDIRATMVKTPALANSQEYAIFVKLHMVNIYCFINVPPDFRSRRFSSYLM